MLAKLFAICVLLATFAFSAVNINTANEKELTTAKGISAAKAKAIIDYRTKNGNFKSVEDLKKVSGFGDKLIASVKPELTVGDLNATKK